MRLVTQPILARHNLVWVVLPRRISWGGKIYVQKSFSLRKIGKGLVRCSVLIFFVGQDMFLKYWILSIIEKVAGMLTVDIFWISKWFGRPDVSHRCKNRHPLDFLIDPLYNIYPTSSFLGARLQFEIPCGPRVFQVSSGKKQPSWLEYPETFVYSGVSSNLSWINAAHHYHHRSQMAFWTWRSWNRSSTMMSSPTAWRSEFCCYYYSTTHPSKGVWEP